MRLKSKILCLFASSALATTFYGNLPALAADGSRILGLSTDGSVMLDQVYDQTSSSYSYQLTSTATGVAVQLAAPTGASNFSPKALSADGKTVTGTYRSQNTGYNMAFVWTDAGGYTELGTLGVDSNASYGVDVSADGATAVGYASILSYKTEAFYWTAATGMVSFGTFGGNDSRATAISQDGTTVIGEADIADQTSHAFVGTVASGTIQNIDTLYQSSSATKVIKDGSVVAGTGSTATSTNVFRWTASTGMVDIGTLGGAYTSLSALSADGNVLVGSSLALDNNTRAYRYVASSAIMSDLGALGGTTSYASDVNADGSLVVGSATDAASTRHGFVWSEATGMATVEEWLGTHGIDAGAIVTTSAEKISADGQIVVGQTDHGTTYIARTVKETTGDGGSEPETGNGGSEPETGNGDPDTGNGGNAGGGNPGGGEGGIIDTAAYFPTVATTNSVVLQSGVNNADTIMFGAQGAPMRNLLSVGQKAVWGTVDGGYDDSDVADGGLALGEFGLGYGIADGVTARFSAGGTYTKQDLDAGGDVKQRGFYLSPEFSADLGRNLYVTVGGYWGRSSIDTRRGYLSGAATDYSEGDTNAETWGAKIRFDWLNAFSVEKTAITPYAGLSYARTKADAFTETGGSFPVHFDESSDHATIVRLGADFVHPLTDSVRLLAKTELDYQFESHAAATSGTLIGISAFDLAGRDLDQFWLRGGIGAEFDVGKGVASFMVNATTQGQDPTIWVRSNWTVKF